MKTLSIAIIAKNEQALIARCLESVQGADQIVVVDTGSTDSTKEIARSLNAEVYEFPWVDDYSAARNAALLHCTGDYVLSIDCDEFLEEGGIEKIREAIESGQSGYTIRMKSEEFEQYHHPVRLFKRDEHIFWIGRGHEVVNVQGTYTDILITYGYSPAHTSDPDRMFRIMQKAVNENPNPRNLYYLAREFYYRHRYEEAIPLFQRCAGTSQWLPEKADAMLTIARCHWFMSRGEDARRVCLETIRVNPMFKEALLFMSELHFSPYKEKWATLANSADNSDVLFLRT